VNRCIIALFLMCGAAHAAQYYVRTDGADTNDGLANAADAAGTAGQAWLTIDKALTVALAGDTVTVAAGSYPEYAQSKRSGTNSNLITFNTTGGDVFCQGWKFTHSYISVNGFTARYHSQVSSNDSAFALGSNCSNIFITNCKVGPGMWLHATNFVFSDVDDTIYTATGGFIAAGFRIGATVKISDSTALNQTDNDGKTVTVTNVTDTTLTVSAENTLIAESGKTAILFGGARAFAFSSTANNVNIDGCSVVNAACIWATMSGSNNIIQNCTFANGLGFDGVLYGGTNNIVRRNLIKDSMDVKYWSPTPDALAQNDKGNGDIDNVTVTENIIMDWKGVLGFDHGNPGQNLIISNNVVYNCGGGWVSYVTQNTSFLNNTIINTGIDSISGFRQAIDHVIGWKDSTYNPTTGSVTNNIIVGCGYNQTNTVGWYENDEPSLNLTSNYNFVTGPSPSFAAKTGFSEVNGINGSNPMFVNINDPLGPDGLIFTADDGLRLAAGSPAIGAGPAGADLGAYDYSASPPPVESGTINAVITNAGTVTVQ
jgi:hypothetical protein